MRVAIVALILALCVGLAASPALADPAFSPGEPAQIGDVSDATTLRLVDGRRLRLVGIEGPARGVLAQQAKDALTKLVAGGAVELRFAGNTRDRHGSVLAQLYAGSVWVQGELLRRGLARVRY